MLQVVTTYTFGKAEQR